MAIRIEPRRLHWLSERPEQDGCAHGGFVIRDGDRLLLDDSSETWTLSAAALHLLRSLNGDHSGPPNTEHLFPCCGMMIGIEGQADVVLMGCASGRNLRVRHRNGEVTLIFEDDREVAVTGADWRQAVLGFVDEVDVFYAKSAPKRLYDSMDADGFAAFREEWRRRRTNA